MKDRKIDTKLFLREVNKGLTLGAFKQCNEGTFETGNGMMSFEFKSSVGDEYVNCGIFNFSDKCVSKITELVKKYFNVEAYFNNTCSHFWFIVSTKE